MVTGLSQSLSGWTGAITVEKGVTVTVTPVDGDSVASLMSRLVQRAEALIGYDWQAVADAAGVLTLSSTVGNFDLTTSGNVAARTALASGTSAGSYTGSGSHEGGIYPSRGMSVSPGTPTTTRGRYSGDGSMVVPGRRAPGRVVLVAYDVHASLWSLEASLSGVYDVWADGARGVLARVRVTSTRRVRQGRSAQDGLGLEITGPEVSR
ncbi:MAG: hypothetical protein H6698_09640 [Myxococcales bacterium]|nr:hypothetical protein [Myxococcales bacterium]MCB9532642.1 hypothetical protein [Myxococcales bacterium]MCB9534544.1 hypothetical protein [Myxococcales bacterium]